MTGSGVQLSMVRGVVISTKEQMHSVRVNRKTGFGRVNATRELWLREKDGKEHQYQGDMFDAAEPGHEVAVISKQPSGNPMAFANFTTGLVHEGPELNVSTSVGSTLTSTFVISLLLGLPGLFVWALLLESFGLGESAFTAGGFQIYVVLLVACVYAGLTFWSKGYRERSGKLRKEIDHLLASEPAASAELDR